METLNRAMTGTFHLLCVCVCGGGGGLTSWGKPIADKAFRQGKTVYILEQLHNSLTTVHTSLLKWKWPDLCYPPCVLECVQAHMHEAWERGRKSGLPFANSANSQYRVTPHTNPDTAIIKWLDDVMLCSGGCPETNDLGVVLLMNNTALKIIHPPFCATGKAERACVTVAFAK